MGYNRESKEEIKDRMIRTALDYWNIRKVENLDPLVRLLIEALAMQLHNISDEIADIEIAVTHADIVEELFLKQCLKFCLQKL